jgi:hypothetical protein
MDGDPLDGLLDSPLDDPPPGRRRSAVMALVTAGLLAVAAIVVGVIAFGGSEDDDPGDTTTNPSPVPDAVLGHPDDRVYARLVATDSDVYLFGGMEPVQNLNGIRYDDVWRYDTDSGRWWDLRTPVGPAPRAGAALAYDAGSDLVVLFGGAVGGCDYPFCPDMIADTWVYDPTSNTWEERSPASSPSPRHGHTMAYDAASDRVVLYGGDSGTQWLEDTWAYDADADEWTEVAAGEPPWRTALHATAYDPVRDRVVVWGGADRDGTLTWALDLEMGEWEQLDLDPAPVAAWDACMVWAPGSERLVVIGGEGYVTEQIAEGVTTTEIRLHDEVWALDLGIPAWTMITRLPQPVATHGCAVDPDSGAVVVWSLDSVMLVDDLTGAVEVADPPPAG